LNKGKSVTVAKARGGASLRVELRGVDLPGRSCGPRPGGGWYEDIHVGLKRGTSAIDLVPGDAATANWSIDVTVRETENGRDFGGPFVSGHRDDRHLGLRWYGRIPDGSVENFRVAKLRFVEIQPALIDQALVTGRPLIGRVVLTDEHGWPRCARVHPPAITWSVGDP
jgi:Family of unknown function (DUF5990)